MTSHVPGASVLYVRATRTSLLRAVRTQGSGQLGLGEGLPYVHRTRIILSRAARTAYRGTAGDGTLRNALWAQSEKLVAEAGLALPEKLMGSCEAAAVV